VFPSIFSINLLAFYRETCIKRTPAHMKRTPSIKWRPAWVPKLSSHINCKINLHLAVASVKRTRTPILSHFVTQKPAISGRFKGFLLLKAQLRLLSLTLFSDVVLKLSRLFQIDALTDWALCYEQYLITLCETVLQKV